MTFARASQAELKDGYLNGHRVRTAHIKGTTVYTVKIDNHAEVTFRTAREFAKYLYTMTKEVNYDSNI